MSDDQISAGVPGDVQNDLTAPLTPHFVPHGWTVRPTVADVQEEAPAPVPAVAVVDGDAGRETGPAARRRRYRERHPRIDYVPSDEAYEVIDEALDQNHSLGVSRVLDALVISAAQHFTKCMPVDISPGGSVEQPTGPRRATE